MAEAVLSVRDLHLEFGEESPRRGKRRIHALRGVDLDLFPGECLALVGESGCGKTTLARAVLGLVRPSRGSVRFRGEDVGAFSRRELMAYRRKVQIVFQDPFGSLNPRLRAGQMLDEVLKVHSAGLTPSARGDRVESLLSMVGLRPEAARRYPHEFSGGQRQRLGIARALSVEPEVLILDEPVSALDLSVQAQILNLLADLRDTLELTYLFSTHDLSVVRQVADRVGVIYLGEVVEMGPVAGVLEDPQHPYARGLLAAAVAQEDPAREKAIWSILPGEPPDPSAPPTGCAFHPRCPHPSKGPRCRASSPSLEPLAPGREAACWMVREHLAGS